AWFLSCAVARRRFGGQLHQDPHRRFRGGITRRVAPLALDLREPLRISFEDDSCDCVCPRIRVRSMIITRSPLRICLGGGGTDLPSYYRQHTGFVISAAINRYVYITINEAFRPRIIVKYSKFEDV